MKGRVGGRQAQSVVVHPILGFGGVDWCAGAMMEGCGLALASLLEDKHVNYCLASEELEARLIIIVKECGRCFERETALGLPWEEAVRCLHEGNGEGISCLADKTCDALHERWLQATTRV